MPSDDRNQQALRAVRGPLDAFRSAVTGAVEEVRAYLAAQRPPADGAAGRAAAELGAFAASHLEVERFAGLFAGRAGLPAGLHARVERALATLGRVAAAGESAFLVTVEPGADLRATVGWTLGELGRAFLAAQSVELIRSGRFHAERDADDPEVFPFLDSFPFARWNRAERQIAPPLVVEVEGSDLQVGGLGEFLDGVQKLVLVVRGPCPPAALVRLVTPSVMVAQTTEPAELAALCRVPGPAAVALVPEGAARFVHHPAGGPALRDRLVVHHLPEADAVERIGSLSAFQQREELRQLAALAAAAAAPAPAGATAEAETVPAGDATERLAAWLLRSADLADLG